MLGQGFLFGVVFPAPPFDDVADRYQADNLAVLDHRQMPEFARGHHFHDRGDGIGLLAADDLPRHHRPDRLVEHPPPRLPQHAHRVTLPKDALHTPLSSHPPPPTLPPHPP